MDVSLLILKTAFSQDMMAVIISRNYKPNPDFSGIVVILVLIVEKKPHHD